MTIPHIALIHATPLAMAPVAQAFSRLWPQARCMSLLDDSLPRDLAAAGSLTPAVAQRIASLAQYAKGCGVHGILYTCSAFGPAIDQVAGTIGLPTLKPNEAMFQEAITRCAELGDALNPPVAATRRIGLLTTFAPAGASMAVELLDAARQHGAAIELASACAVGAMQALSAGDKASHDRLVLAQALELRHCDVVLLGQFSMAHMQAQVAQSLGLPVLSSPDSAVRAMQRALSALS